MYQFKNEGFEVSRTKNIDTIFLVKKSPSIAKPMQGSTYPDPETTTTNLKKAKRNKRPARFYFAIILIFFLAIFPIRVVNKTMSVKAKASESIETIDSVFNSIKTNDYETASTEIKKLQNNLFEINRELEKNGQKNIFINQFLPLKDITADMENLLDATQIALDISSSLISDLVYVSQVSFSSLNANENNEDFFSKIEQANRNLKESSPNFQRLKEKIQLIQTNGFGAKEKKYIEALKSNIDDIERYYYSILDLTENMPDVLGKNYDKKYLVLFKNNAEIRPTGGFIGTYGIITIRDAKIKNIFVDSIYNPDGQMSKKIDPPEPLKKITQSLTMRDSNWDPDFSSSAKLITQLYEMQGGFTPDGVIGIDTKPFLDLLRVTGPIMLDKYGLEINEGNFIETTQYKTSFDYDPSENNPKKFLADFAPIFIDRILNNEENNKEHIFSVINDNIGKKHIQFYSQNSNVQKVFSDLGISGEIEDYGGDYFNYISANIGGQKTNNLIKEEIKHEINIDSNGNVIRKVVITRKHNGKYDWPSGINYSYVRFYLPDGSEPISIKNFEKGESIRKDAQSGMIYLEERDGEYPGKANLDDLDISSEHGKTVVGAWLVIKPGEEQVSEIIYKLPFKVKGNESKYSLLIQKQAGIISQKTEILISQKTSFFSSKKKVLSFDLTKDEEILIDLSR